MPFRVETLFKKCNYPENLITKNIERAKQPIQRNEEMLGIETETSAFATTYSPSLTFDETISGNVYKEYKQID